MSLNLRSVQERKLILTLGKVVFQLRLKGFLVNSFMYLSILDYWKSQSLGLLGKKQHADPGSLLKNADPHNARNPDGNSEDVAVLLIYLPGLWGLVWRQENATWHLGAFTHHHGQESQPSVWSALLSRQFFEPCYQWCRNYLRLLLFMGNKLRVYIKTQLWEY